MEVTLNGLDSLPRVPQGHIKKMHEEAAKMAADEGFTLDAPAQQQAIKAVQQDPDVKGATLYPDNTVYDPVEEVEEVAAVEEQHVEEAEEVEEVEEEPVRKHSSTAKQDNLRYFREARERAERERDEALRMARELQQRYEQPKAQEEDFTVNIGDEDIAEGKHINKVKKGLKHEINELRAELDNYKKQTAAIHTENLIKSQYPDFYDVVTPESIELLSAKKPFLMNLVQQSKDDYSRAASMYDAIKESGLVVPKNVLRDKVVAKKNLAKPQVSASLSPRSGDTPLSKVGAFTEDFTDAMKKQYHKEMMSAMKNRR